MEAEEFLRVVCLRKGKLKPVEFKLREGEKGLSLFAHVDEIAPEQVVEAVREAGKKGELAVAVLPARAIKTLGLRLVQTPGDTPLQEVNAIHYEARLPLLRGLLLRVAGSGYHEYFNEQISHRLFTVARVLD